MNFIMVNSMNLDICVRKKITNEFFGIGRQTSHDIAEFVRDNAFSPLRALTPTDFPSVKLDDKPFIIDFFSPVSDFQERLNY